MKLKILLLAGEMGEWRKGLPYSYENDEDSGIVT